MLALAVAPAALAEDGDPLVGDRPDFTESAITVAPGRVQIEAGITRTEAGRTESLDVGEVLVRIGLAPRFEVRLGLGSYGRVDGPGPGDPSGFADPSVGAKLGLGERLGWTTAVLASTTLPAGSSEFREPHPQPKVVLAAQRGLTDVLSIAANLGYAYASAGGVQYGEASASVSAGVGLGESTGAYLEVFGILPASAGGPETYFVDAGATYLFNPDFQIDLRAGVGLNSAASDFFFGAGVVWRR